MSPLLGLWYFLESLHLPSPRLLVSIHSLGSLGFSPVPSFISDAVPFFGFPLPSRSLSPSDYFEGMKCSNLKVWLNLHSSHMQRRELRTLSHTYTLWIEGALRPAEHRNTRSNNYQQWPVFTNITIFPSLFSLYLMPFTEESMKPGAAAWTDCSYRTLSDHPQWQLTYILSILQNRLYVLSGENHFKTFMIEIINTFMIEIL